MYRTNFLTVLMLIPLGLSVARATGGEDELGRRASWAPPAAERVRAQVGEWLDKQGLDAAARREIQSLWALEAAGAAPASQLLERLARSAAKANQPAGQLVSLCSNDQRPDSLPKFDFLSGQSLPGLIRNNLKLYYGRWLIQRELYDEALEQLGGLTPADVVDPASLLFLQSVAHHRLLEKEKCVSAVAKLLENEALVPRRYAVLARLIEADLAPLKTDSLDEVARLMDDIRRRLSLHRAGVRVRKQQEDVIAKLDKMIQQMEKQQQQQQQAGSQAAGKLAPSRPMPDSMPGGGKGPGDVDPRKLGGRSGWGDLPPKEREQALQQISKDLPAHYREVIEEYFRKIARDTGR